MIALLRGVVASQSDNVVVIDVAGVGYEVHVSSSTALSLVPNAETRLHIHTSVREDAIQLFGFTSTTERDVFLKLTTVTGIGPKLAMGVLSGASLDEVLSAVATGDVKRLVKIPGIGKKTAERIVLELQEAFKAIAPAAPATAARPTPKRDGSLGDVRSALQNLGFKPAAIDYAIEQLEANDNRPKDFDALLRDALRLVR